MGSTSTNFAATMLVAVQSIGTTATLAFAGFYLHRRGFVLGNTAKKTMAFLSQQITIPSLLLTNLVACDPDPVHPDQCFSVTDSFQEGLWILLVWPLYVVAWGAIIGYLMALLSQTSNSQRRRQAVVGATAFANSSGLPLTLIVAIQASLPPDSTLVQTYPTTLISCYMIVFPMLQWGIGAFLFPTENDDEPSKKEEGAAGDVEAPTNGAGETVDPDELPTSPEGVEAVWKRLWYYLRLFSAAGSKFCQPPVIGALLGLCISATPELRGLFVDLSPSDGDSASSPLEWLFNGVYTVGQAAVPINMVILGINLSMALGDNWNNPCRSRKQKIEDSSSTAFLLQEEDQPGAVPTTTTRAASMSMATTMAVIVGKLVLMPLVGIASVLVLEDLSVLAVPPNIEGPLYLVLMLVFVTPTANNLMVLVELSAGQQAKQDVAKLLAWQYAVAPILLSLSVAVVVLVAH